MWSPASRRPLRASGEMLAVRRCRRYSWRRRYLMRMYPPSKAPRTIPRRRPKAATRTAITATASLNAYPDPDPHSGPEQHACEVIESEPDASNGNNAGQRRHDRRQARDELRDQHRTGAKAGEYVLSASHTEIRPVRTRAPRRRPNSYHAK